MDCSLNSSSFKKKKTRKSAKEAMRFEKKKKRLHFPSAPIRQIKYFSFLLLCNILSVTMSLQMCKHNQLASYRKVLKSK